MTWRATEQIKAGEMATVNLTTGEVRPESLAEFLLARIEDDEEQATSGWSRVPDERWSRTDEGQNVLSPDAILAECKWKRRIVELADTYRFDSGAGGWLSGRVMMHLAQPYADHPDFRDEWRQ